MIHEYALDPGTLGGRFIQLSAFFEEAFNQFSGRHISEFPRHWSRQVLNAFHVGGGAKGSHEELELKAFLRRLDERAIRRRGIRLEQAAWVEQAQSEHANRPFHAIMSSSNPQNHQDVIPIAAYRQHRLWAQPREQEILRSPQEMARAASPLLRSAKHIVFVDPYFDVLQDCYLQSFQSFFSEIWQSNTYQRPQVEIITGLKGCWERGTGQPRQDDINSFQNECTARLSVFVPQGCRIKMHLFKEKRGGQQLHNRYILTNLAGIKFPAGLGCGPANRRTGDDLSLISNGSIRQLWGIYTNRRPAAFDEVIPSFDIDGVAP